jgi:flagellar basal-body rod modification protein FlgD
VAQLQNQDPLKPQENAEFVAELAQFSNLEQVIGINDRLDLLAIQGRGLANTEVVTLVGKDVTVKGTTITIDGSGGVVPVAFQLGAKSQETRINIHDQSGRIVRTIDAGARNAGAVQVTWDGKGDNGLYQPPGPYSISVEAKGANGGPVTTLQESKGNVIAVSFDKGYPLLHLDNGLSVPVADLLRVDSSQTNP